LRLWVRWFAGRVFYAGECTDPTGIYKAEQGVFEVRLLMTNWVRCTTTVGDKMLINFDYVAVIQHDARKRQTAVSFADGNLAVLIRETPDQLVEGGLSTFVGAGVTLSP
jgi:hypothetical protein